MGSLISTLAKAALGRSPKLVCPDALWREGVKELRRRTGLEIESGAFLLGHKNRLTRKVSQFLYYDDVDPQCFRNGMVEFDGRKLGEVWQKCRDLSLEVVADVHVHPYGYGQSYSDRHNPIIPNEGHLAIILPDYANKGGLPGNIGIYEYQKSHKWLDHSKKGRDIFHVGWWP